MYEWMIYEQVGLEPEIALYINTNTIVISILLPCPPVNRRRRMCWYNA